MRHNPAPAFGPNTQHADYARIEKAIHFICDNAAAQPSLNDIAAAVHLSPQHFQRTFTAWAGVSPKKFIQYLSLNHAKQLLAQRTSLADTAAEVGLSGSSRLHDLFVRIEHMTPGDYKNGGAALTLRYAFYPTQFGSVIIAATEQGVCHIHFENNEHDAVRNLAARYPNAVLKNHADSLHDQALTYFTSHTAPPDATRRTVLPLHLAGTPFQLKVWESLLTLPFGSLATYGDIANQIQQPNAARAVGSAIGKNPIAFLIPCHRVIQQSGRIGGYMWGSDKKRAILGWESAQQHAVPDTNNPDINANT